MNRLLLLVAAALTLPLPAQQKIAFTWDDLPAHSTLPPGETRQQIIDEIIRTIQAEHLPTPYGFVNASQIERQPELIHVLDAWRAASFPLGNHTWSHLNLSDPTTTLDTWQTNVLRNEPVLQKEMTGADFHWLRYPNLGEGDTQDKKLGARKFLAAQGYKVAAVTMSFGDYAYNDPYARCMTLGDQAAVKRLEDSYLEEAARNLESSHQMSNAALGHDIPYVLLMHIGALDAKLLPRLIALYRQHGVTFIGLQEAMQDPFYRNDLDLSLNPEPDTLEGAMRLKGLPLPKRMPVSVDLTGICRSPQTNAP